MYRSAFQKGFLTVLYAGGANPLKIWDRHVMNGHVKRVTDEDVRTLVLEICGTNVATCYIYAPVDPKEVLGVRLPFLVMIIKNLKKYFSFEIMILDDRHMRRRFRVSNYQSTTKVRPFGTTMPIGLNPGWNQIQFNLADFTKRAYGSTYVETQKIQIHANCRVRRIYFCDRLYPEDELPNDYKLFYPVAEDKSKKAKKGKEVKKEAEVPPPSEAGDEAEVQGIAEVEPTKETEVEIPDSIEPEPPETPGTISPKKEPSIMVAAAAQAPVEGDEPADSEPEMGGEDDLGIEDTLEEEPGDDTGGIDEPAEDDAQEDEAPGEEPDE